MNKKYLLSLLTCLLMAMFTLTSCGSDSKDDTPEPAPAPINAITIVNSSTNSFMPLYIYWRNVTGEVLTTTDLGDCHPNETKSSSIPGSAATYFLVTFANGNTYYTADHLTSETTFTITNATTWYVAN